MEIFAFWLMAAAVVAAIASSRGRSGIGWFFLACVISPLLAVVLVLALDKKPVSSTSDLISGPTTKKCPLCAEFVKIEAIKCKHCGADLPPADPLPVDESADRKQGG